jgi:hypothetical protein
MIRTSNYSEFAENFLVWKNEKGITSHKLAEVTEFALEEVDFMLSGRFPYSLSFLSKLKAYYPDFGLLRPSSASERAIELLSVSTDHWDSLKHALLKPEEIRRVVIFYKDGSYREF